MLIESYCNIQIYRGVVVYYIHIYERLYFVTLVFVSDKKIYIYFLVNTLPSPLRLPFIYQILLCYVIKFVFCLNFPHVFLYLRLV